MFPRRSLLPRCDSTRCSSQAECALASVAMFRDKGGKPMAEILGLGVTHSPLLVGSDARMAGIFGRTLDSPRVPADAKHPANWPAVMQAEWAAHQAGQA